MTGELARFVRCRLTPVALRLPGVQTSTFTRTDHLLRSGASVPEALTHGFQSAFLGGAVIAALGVIATLVLIRTRDSRAHLEMAQGQTSAAHA